MTRLCYRRLLYKVKTPRTEERARVLDREIADEVNPCHSYHASDH